MRSILLSLIIVLALLCGCSSNLLFERIEAITVKSTPGPGESDAISAEEKVLIDSFYDIPAPDFELYDSSGSIYKLSDISDKIIVLCFFATWNKYCVDEFKFLTAANEEFSDVVFLGINTGERRDMSLSLNKEFVLNFARENGLDIPILFDEDSSVYDSLYYVRGLPATFVIDKDGRIRNIISGSITAYPELRPYISSVVKSAKQSE